MNAVDTNVVVRLLTRDDEQQFSRSLKLFQEQDVFIPDSIILEIEWVLRFAFHFKSAEICAALRNLFGLPNVQIRNGSQMVQVLEWHESGLDFADALHLAQSQSCSSIYIFDDRFVKRAKELADCEVQPL